MASKTWKSMILVLICLQFVFFQVSRSSPLEVRSRWIVDSATGRRVKLACVNWAGHLQPALPEGLHRHPISHIAATIKSLGFNCVRLTYSIYMLTHAFYTNSTVGHTFQSLNLTSHAAAVEKNNPGLLDLTHLQAYRRVIAGLSAAGVIAVLDNHVSKPMWCCATSDGNGFFGDRYFDPVAWVLGLQRMAEAFRGTANVVAMSLRNELRGNRQTPSEWSKYMQQGAEAVHAANPDVLVILSGLNFDTTLGFLSDFPVTLPFREKKIVYEVHWYSFGTDWAGGEPNNMCGSITADKERRAGFVTNPVNGTAAPLFISEFGIDQRGINKNDNRYVNCFLAFAAAGDFDWALWTLQGSYYIREDRPNPLTFDETYGIFNGAWTAVRNPGFMARLKSIQEPIQDPNFSSGPSYQIIYHPSTGLCVESKGTRIMLGSCKGAGSRWNFNVSVEGLITLVGSSRNIGVQGDGMPGILSEVISATNATLWKVVSNAKLQVATRDSNGNLMCLDGSSNPSILVKRCICVEGSGCSPTDNPETQWFKVITTARDIE